jgi:hypothetical protein
VKAQLVNDKIKPEKKVELALAIIDREIDLLGTKAPAKSIQARIDAEVDPGQLVGYRRFVRATAGLSDTQVEELYGIASRMTREFEMPQPPLDAELWKNEEGS